MFPLRVRLHVTVTWFLPGKIPWAKEPGGLQSMGLQTVGRDWVTEHRHHLVTLAQTKVIVKKNWRCPNSQQKAGHVLGKLSSRKPCERRPVVQTSAVLSRNYKPPHDNRVLERQWVQIEKFSLLKAYLFWRFSMKTRKYTIALIIFTT